MNISLRLPLIVGVCAIASSIAVGAGSFWQSEKALEEATVNKLVGLRDSRAAAFQSYLEGVEEDVALLAKSPVVVDALSDFTNIFRSFGISQARTESLLRAQFDKDHPQGRDIPRAFLTPTVASYQWAHDEYHPWLSLLLELKGYHEIFLINLRGDIVYTSGKEADFATNLLTGPWSDTNLASVIAGARQSPPQVDRQFTDFARFAPSGDEPASFISEPVYNNGELLGVIALQMPIERLNEIMQLTAGMGRTGETYVVGADRLMRTDSRFEEEDSILRVSVNSEQSERALAGETGSMIAAGYRGIPVLAAYAPFQFRGSRWAILSEIELAEIRMPSAELARTVAMIVGLIGITVLLVGIGAARTITVPLSKLSDSFHKFGDTRRLDGDVPGVERRDELGDIARVYKKVAGDIATFIRHQETEAERLEHMVQLRTNDVMIAQMKLQSLVDRGIALSSELKEERLFDQILDSAKELANADGGTLYLLKENELHFENIKNDTLGIRLGGDTGEPIDFPAVQLVNAGTGEENHANVASHCALVGETVIIDDAYADDRFDFSGTRSFDENTKYHSTSFLTVPLRPRGKNVIGVIQLINATDPETGAVIPFDREVVGFVEALAAQASIALDNQALIEAQKNLLDSFIELIAAAIDAKSPYTGGHCNRVPELAMMLAEAAEQTKTGPLADFKFANEDEWREFRIAAWLHDCGKVTTPEFVVDKATKLETIYNRIHEIRTRFEVLLRDLEISHLKAQLAGDPVDEAAFDAAKAKLQDDFAFVAECNIGGEYMSIEKKDRLHDIARRTWVRHFSDRLGLSIDEQERIKGRQEAVLPVTEHLLADKPGHITPRSGRADFGDNPHGFDMEIPEHANNAGELYNLCIERGTLTPEERFKINDHIVQTIIMLNELPYPDHLKRVPEIAGNHHETMIGTGYPRKLTREQMSIPSRIMAIADVFEALTASDRPYKPAKPLSESIRIMGFMRDDEHIDADLFDLFLNSGVYQRYADAFLLPEQCDEIDLSQYTRSDAPGSDVSGGYNDQRQ